MILIGCLDVTILALDVNSMPTLLGVGDQQMAPTNRGCFYIGLASENPWMQPVLVGTVC